MGRIEATMPSFCLSKMRPILRVRSPTLSLKKCSSSNSSSNKKDYDEKSHFCSVDNEKISGYTGRKIMVVIDSSVESKNALYWALTHTVQSQDLVILLYVNKCSHSGDHCVKEISPRVSEFLSCMKIICQQRRPEVHIMISVTEGKEKGPLILEAAKKQGVALLVLGQKKRAAVTWRLLMMWAGQRAAGGGVVEYCIQNAGCMAVAVRRKSKKLGGYLITTKRQKDFWLLA